MRKEAFSGIHARLNLMRVRRGILREGSAMIEDVIGCLIAVAFGVMVAFQIGGEG